MNLAQGRHAITSLFTVVSLLASQSLQAQSSDHSHHAPATSAQAATATWAEAQVLKVDPDSRKVTLKHGEITALDMPPMTMVFQVDDPNLFKGLNAGERIGFKATHEQGRYVLTAWQKK